jgi:hypothetical protein
VTTLCTTPGCGNPSPSAFVCVQCGDELKKSLSYLPGLLIDLEEVTLTRQDKMGMPPTFNRTGIDLSKDRKPLPPHLRSKDAGYALPSTPWPYSQAASVELDDAVNTLTTWTRHVVEVRGLRPLAPHVELHRDIRTATATACARWLHVNVEAVRQDEAGGQIVDEIAYLVRTLTHAVDVQDEGEFMGQCDAPIKVDISANVVSIATDPCGGKLYAKTGRATARCPKCNTEHDVAARKREAIEQLDDAIATAREIANGLTTLLQPVTPSMIRQMAFRGQIVGRGFAHDGLSVLYRVGDVVTVLKRRKLSDPARKVRA